MFQKITFFLSLFAFFAVSCSSDEPDPKQEVYPESESIKTIYNADGSYYSLHYECIRLRNANGKLISEIGYFVPDGVTIDKPYGQKDYAPYGIVDFYKYADNIVLVFSADDSNSSTEIGENGVGIAYVFDDKLNEMTTKEFKHGLGYHIEDEYAVVGPDCSLYVYDPIFNFSYKIEKPADADMPTRPAQRHGSHIPAFGKVNGNFYLMGDGKSPYSQDTEEAIIVDYANQTTHLIYKPSRSCIVHDFLPEESSHYPRFDSNTYSFVQDHFEITYPYITYGGITGSVVYKYDVQGNQIEPAYSPHLDFSTFSTKGLITREMFEWLGYEAPDDILCLMQCDSEATIYIEKGMLYKYDRPFYVDFSMRCSNPDIVEVTEISSETTLNNGGHSYSLYAKSVGDVDLVFSTPGYDNILSYRLRVDTYSNIHKK